MSTCEYYDLCYKAQNNLNSKYKVFVFDMIDSKKMPIEERRNAQKQMEELMLRLYDEILNKERSENRKILLVEDVVSYEERIRVNNKFGMLFEPFLLADTFGFTIYRDSITDEEVLDIFNNCMSELNIDYDFHTNSLYYETNEYCMGSELFFRGYAIDIASNLHKDYMFKVKRKVK